MASMPRPSRRDLLGGIGALLMGQSLGKTARAADWTLLPPGESGFAADLAPQLDKAIAEKRIWNVHGVVILRKGGLAFERYFDGEDNVRGQPLGTVVFKVDTLHDLRSVSKSIVGLLYGIALADNKVPPPEAPLFASFPEYADLAADPARGRWTIQHVLTMTMGTDWDELSIPYTDPANSEIAMDRAPDRYRFILERPIVREPGTHWTYSGGATALLARIIAKGTGRPLHDFARERLFDPLALGPTEWLADRNNEPIAASGLRMTPRDLAHIGMTTLEGGMSGGRQIVPAEWIKRSTTAMVDCDEVRSYGYHWYLGRFEFTVSTGPKASRARLEHYWAAIGNGGQRLFVFPGLEMVVAVTAGNYDTPDQWVPPTRLVREVVLPSLS
jgi:CubicO group peptidase (beta-lactamase class C family)